jgi:hypothetical protein
VQALAHESFWIIMLTEKCLPTSRSNVRNDRSFSQLRLFRIRAEKLPEKSSTRSNTSRWAATFASTSLASRTGRSALLARRIANQPVPPP